MNLKYMAIDKNVAFYTKENDLWVKYGISAIRVDSMSEGIICANGNSFLFIIINADNIDYKPKLKILRDVTDAPILVGTSNYSIEEQIEALHHGADFYGECCGKISQNVNMALTVVNNIAERAAHRKNITEIITCKDILIIPAYRKVFTNGGELILTKMEFDILYCLLLHRGRVLSHEQIYSFIFDDGYETPAYDAVKSAIKRLRKKLGDNNVIESVRGVGYRTPVSDIRGTF